MNSDDTDLPFACVFRVHHLPSQDIGYLSLIIVSVCILSPRATRLQHCESTYCTAGLLFFTVWVTTLDMFLSRADLDLSFLPMPPTCVFL